MTGKVNNKTAGVLIFLVMIIAVGLISYLAGFKGGQKQTSANDNLNQETAKQKKLTSDQLPKLPEAPKVSSSSNNLPILPSLTNY